MSTKGRNLKVGDWATTDYNGRQLVTVQITARNLGWSQSGIEYRVTPMLKNGTPDDWYDADWFEPAPPP